MGNTQLRVVRPHQWIGLPRLQRWIAIGDASTLVLLFASARDRFLRQAGHKAAKDATHVQKTRLSASLQCEVTEKKTNSIEIVG